MVHKSTIQSHGLEIQKANDWNINAVKKMHGKPSNEKMQGKQGRTPAAGSEPVLYCPCP